MVIHDQHLGDCVILVVIYGHRLGGSVAGVVRRKHSIVMVINVNNFVGLILYSPYTLMFQ